MDDVRNELWPGLKRDLNLLGGDDRTGSVEAVKRIDE
jgi:hypothetical protein